MPTSIPNARQAMNVMKKGTRSSSEIKVARMKPYPELEVGIPILTVNIPYHFRYCNFNHKKDSAYYDCRQSCFGNV